MASDEPRDDEAQDAESFDEAFLEPGPRRSTYTPPPQFSQRADGTPEPEEPLVRPAPPVFETPSASDFSSIFPDSFESTGVDPVPDLSSDDFAPPVFPEFPTPDYSTADYPDAPAGDPIDLPEFAAPPAWPSPDEPPAGFPTSLADAPPPAFGPPGGFEPPAFDPSTVFQMPQYEEPAAPAPTASRPWYETVEPPVEEAPVEAPAVNLEDLPGPSFTPSPSPAAEGVDEATLLAQQAGPAGQPWIPRRRSLPDDVLAENLSAAVSQPGMTLDAMDELERQLILRDQEAREYQDWEQSMLAVGTPEALAAVEMVRPDFEEIVAATTSIPIQYPEEPVAEVAPDPEPEPEPEPAPQSAPAAVDEFDWNPVPLVDPLEEPPVVETLGPPPLVEPPAAPLPPSLPEAWDPNILPPESFAPVAPEPTPEPLGFPFGPPSTQYSEPDPFADLPEPISAETTTPDVAPLPFMEPAPAADPFTFDNLLVSDGFLSTQTPAEESAPVIVPVATPIRTPFSTEDVGSEPTDIDRRVGRAVRLFWLWFAANSSIVSVALGAILLGLGMSLRQAIIATLAGVLLSFVPLGLGTLAGKRSGQPTMVVSRATFGIHGNIVPALVALASRVFWGAALMWILAQAVASTLDAANLESGLSKPQLVILCLGVAFVLALVIAFFGYALLARFQLVVSILSFALIVGLIALTWQYVDLSVALQVQDGPAILLVTGAVLVFSFVGLVWANASSDLARYQSSGGSGAGSMLWASFGTALPSFALIAYGALLAASDPTIATGLTTDPLATIAGMLPLWYPIPLIAATALSLLSGIVISVYSGSFALAAVGIRVKQTVSVLIVAVLVFGLAWTISELGDFSVLFRDLATTVAVPVAAWAGLFASEVIIRNRPYDAPSLLRTGGIYPAVRWVNLVAFLVITAIGFGLTSSSVGWLAWQGYIATPTGVPVLVELSGADVGVIVALVLGLLVPLVAGTRAIRRQEAAASPN